jgi:hypothetical protein
MNSQVKDKDETHPNDSAARTPSTSTPRARSPSKSQSRQHSTTARTPSKTHRPGSTRTDNESRRAPRPSPSLCPGPSSPPLAGDPAPHARPVAPCYHSHRRRLCPSRACASATPLTSRHSHDPAHSSPRAQHRVHSPHDPTYIPSHLAEGCAVATSARSPAGYCAPREPIPDACP